MRLQLVGDYTPEEIKEAVSTIVDYFQSLKADCFYDIDIYLSSRMDGDSVCLTEEAKVVEHLRFDFGPRRRVFDFMEAVKTVKTLEVNLVHDEEE